MLRSTVQQSTLGAWLSVSSEENSVMIDSTVNSPMPLDISEDFVSAREQKVAGISSIGFDGSLQPPLRLYEDAKEGCGGQLWPAGMVLAKYLIREPQLNMMKDKTMFI